MSQAADREIPCNCDDIVMQDYLLISVEEVENLYNSMQFVPDIQEDIQIERNVTPNYKSVKPSDRFAVTRQTAKPDHTEKEKKSSKNIKILKCRTYGKHSKTYRRAMKNIQRMYRKK